MSTSSKQSDATYAACFEAERFHGVEYGVAPGVRAISTYCTNHTHY